MSEFIVTVEGGGDTVTPEGGGEQQQQQQQNLLPIDLHYDKLIDWLVDRKKVPNDWRKQLKTLHLKWKQVLSQRALEENASEADKVKEKERGKEAERASSLLDQLRGNLPDETSVSNGHFLLSQLKEKLVEEREKGGDGDAGGEAKKKKGGGGGGLFGQALASIGGIGGYSGLLGELDKIIRVYDKSDLHLVENAQFLAKATDYEIPSLSSKVQRLYTQVSDSEKREDEYLRSQQTCAKNFNSACKDWNVDTKEVENKSGLEKKLRRNLSELPVQFDKCIREMRGGRVKESIAYYKAFVRFVQMQTGGGGGEVGEADTKTLDALEELLSGEGEITLQSAYETLLAENGPSVEVVKEEQEISWDIDTGAAPEAEGESEPTFSWDIDMSAGGDAGGGEGVDAAAEEQEPSLSWDIDVSAGQDAGAQDAADADAGGEGEPSLSWDIDMSAGGDAGGGEGDGGDEPTLSWDIDMTAGVEVEDQIVSVSGGGSTIVSDKLENGDTVSLLESSTKLYSHAFKSKVLDNLFELSAFLSQRMIEGESQSGSGMFYSLQMADQVDSILQSTSSEAIQQQKEQVDQVISELTSSFVEKLDLLRSVRSLQKIIRQLEQKQSQEGKYQSMIQGLHGRREDLQRQIMQMKPKLKALVDHTKKVKSTVESVLSKQYDNRPVNVIGQINTVLLETAAAT